MAEGKTYIRASSTSGYGDCARRWAASNLKRELEAAGFDDLNESMPQSIGAGVGTAVHSGAGYMMMQKLQTGALGNETEAAQRALQEIDEAAARGVLWDKETANKNDAQKQTLRMVAMFRHDAAPLLEPSAVERRLQADVGDGFVVTGQSDLQVISPIGVDDLKTGKRATRHFGQIGSYSLLARTEHPGLQVKRLRTIFLQRVPLRVPQPVVVYEEYPQDVAEQAAWAAIGRIKQDVAEFRRRVIEGDAPPEHAFLANPNSNLCSPKFCKAWGTKFCREYRKQPNQED